MTETRMRLRSAVPPHEREQEKLRKQKELAEKLNRPYINFNGKINYATNLIDCAIICDALLKWANESKEDELIVGFDMEWPFSFQTGSGKTALIQISPNLDICHLLHVSHLKSLPKGLYLFLEHPKVRLAGVNIKNDVRKLSRDFEGFNVQQLVDNCYDCGSFAKIVLPFRPNWSLEKLVDDVLKMKINKDKKVRMSQWHLTLDKEQIRYAAIDAYASLLVYLELRKIQLNALTTEI